jgi:hypothetical protein
MGQIIREITDLLTVRFRFKQRNDATKMKNDRYDEYNVFIDQIYEIIQIYDTTDEIIIGGDMKTSPN